MTDQQAIDNPLEVWYCDSCDKPIWRNSRGSFSSSGQPGEVPPEQTGVVAWERPPIPLESPERSLPTEYRVLHKITCDTVSSNATFQTDELLGPEGLQRLAELMWRGPNDDPFVLAPGTTLNPSLELLFRFQVPYYEQARRYLNTSIAQEMLGGRFILSSASWKRLIQAGMNEAEDY